MSSNEEEADYGTGAHWQIKPNRGRANRHLQRTPLADYPKREKRLPKHLDDWDRNGYLDFHDKLNRQLRANLGRPWPKVYSELVAGLKAEFGSHAYEAIDHLTNWAVETRPMGVGDGLYVKANGHPFYESTIFHEFVVHPKTGMLIRPPKAWLDVKVESPRERAQGRWYSGDRVHYDQNRCYRKINGLWYEVELVNLPTNHNWTYPTPPFKKEDDWLYKLNLRDAVLGARIDSLDKNTLALCHGYRTYRGKLVSHEAFNKGVSDYLKRNHYAGHVAADAIAERYVYAKSIRQISKAEINRLGIERPKLTLPNIA